MARIALAWFLAFGGLACTTGTSSTAQPDTAGDASQQQEPPPPANDAGAQPDTGMTMVDEPVQPPGADATVVPHEDPEDGGVITPVSDASVPKDGSSDNDAGFTGERIDLTALRIFFTPTNSIRVGAWGYDAERGLCVSVAWYIDDIDATRFCPPANLMRLQPYVVVKAMEDPGSIDDPKWEHQDSPCWAYDTNVEILEQRGCADFGELTDDSDDQLNLELDVTSDDFDGTLRFKYGF